MSSILRFSSLFSNSLVKKINNRSVTQVRTYESAKIKHSNYFKSIVGDTHVITEGDEKKKYNIDWTGTYESDCIVCFPNSTYQVSKILSYCNQHNIAVVPQGGLTGLVGGAVGLGKDELILSLARMNQIIEINETDSLLKCEAGCILENLQSLCAKSNLIVPLDLGAKGSCMIGGNIATNAGGLHVVKYGSLQHTVLGLEVVLADGTVLDMMRTSQKDNCGYHLKHLFIGAEGTLGVITKVCLSLSHKPNVTNVLFAKLADFSKVTDLLSASKRILEGSLHAFEFMDAICLTKALRLQAPHLLMNLGETVMPKAPSSSGGGFSGEVCVLIETGGAIESLEQHRLEYFLSEIIEGGLVEDAVLAHDSTQEKALWQIREHIPVALLEMTKQSRPHIHSKLHKFDLSLPLREVPSFLTELEKTLTEVEGFNLHGGKQETRKRGWCRVQFFNFGHAADGNIHLNIISTIKATNEVVDRVKGELIGLEAVPEDLIENAKKDVKETIEKHVYSLISKRKGSISAEHGIGQQKAKILEKLNETRSSEEMSLMRAIKLTLDPKNIMNPGKVLTAESLTPKT